METETHPFSNLTPDLVMDATESVGFRCDARILEEHVFTQDLSDNDISVVAPLKIKSESTLETYAGFRFALYPRRGGRAPDVDNLDSLEILGRHIGRIHAFGSDEKFKFRPTISVETYGTQSRHFLLENNFIPLELIPAYEALADPLLADLDKIFSDASSIEEIRLHGDCHMGNVLWRNDLPHFVDFDDARMGLPIQDLWMMLSGEREDQTQQLTSILKGYKDFCHFNYSQIRLIEPLRTLRMMHHSCWIAKKMARSRLSTRVPIFQYREILVKPTT